MRVNQQNKSMDMEVRDLNYILPAYLRSYLFFSKNEDPEKIIFPMFSSTPHPHKQGVTIPIEYVPPLDPIVIEMAQDGANVAEVTPEQEAVMDKKDEEIKRLRAEIEDLRTDLPHAAKAIADEKIDKGDAVVLAPKPKAKSEPPAGRAPKLPPGGDIGAGLSLSDTHPRDARAEKHIGQDLREEPYTDDAEEKEFGKTIKRDDKGNPIVEE